MLTRYLRNICIFFCCARWLFPSTALEILFSRICFKLNTISLPIQNPIHIQLLGNFVFHTRFMIFVHSSFHNCVLLATFYSLTQLSRVSRFKIVKQYIKFDLGCMIKWSCVFRVSVRTQKRINSPISSKPINLYLFAPIPCERSISLLPLTQAVQLLISSVLCSAHLAIGIAFSLSHHSQHSGNECSAIELIFERKTPPFSRFSTYRNLW